MHTAIDINGDPATIRTATWTVYLDAVHETRTAQGYAEYDTLTGQWDNCTIVGPISITRTDRDGRVTDQIQATYSGTVADLATTAILQSDYTAWTHSIYKNTRLWATAVYYAIPSGTSDPDGDGFIGSATENYTLTAYGYENYGVSTDKGRLNKTVAVTSITVNSGVVAFNGTITRYVLDARGNITQTWMGTDDDGATDADPTGNNTTGNNMVEISSFAYDADGNLISTTQYPGGTAYNLTTTYKYDWRNRETDVLSPADVVTYYDYDNRGDVLWTKTYASSDINNLLGSELRAETQNLYDSLGRVYESDVYQVDPTTGTVGDHTQTTYWYDG